MLDGVPRIGWSDASPSGQIERIVDRLVLEVLLGTVHRQAALDIHQHDGQAADSCYITWVPDAWTLSALRHEMQRAELQPSSVRQILYPGYGLTNAEIAELEPIVTAFHPETKLVSFEEAWQ